VTIKILMPESAVYAAGVKTAVVLSLSGGRGRSGRAVRGRAGGVSSQQGGVDARMGGRGGGRACPECAGQAAGRARRWEGKRCRVCWATTT